MDACRAQAPGGGSSRGGQYPRMPGVDRACGGAAGLHVLTGGGMLRCQPGLQPRIGKARPPAAGFPARAAEDGPPPGAACRRRPGAAAFRPFSGAAGRGDVQGITGGPASRLGPKFGRRHAQGARALIEHPLVKSRCVSKHVGLDGLCRDAGEAAAGLLLGGRGGRATTSRPGPPFGMRRGAPPGLFGGVGG